MLNYLQYLPPFEDPESTHNWCAIEFDKVSRLSDTLHDLNCECEAPINVENGMFRYQDGVGWDPVGVGEPALILYNDGEWTLVITLQNLKNFSVLKSNAVDITGASTSDPTVNDSYNVTSVVRNATGVYRVTVTQTAILGINILDMLYASIQYNIPDAGQAVHVEVIKVSSSTYDIKTYTLDVSGSTVVYTAYDLTSNDSVRVMLMLNAGSSLLPAT